MNLKNSILISCRRRPPLHTLPFTFEVILDILAFEVLKPSDIVGDNVMIVATGTRHDDHSLFV